MLAAEGFGLFFLPGETTLVAAAVDSAMTGNLNIIILIAIATCGAITGDNFAFYVGRRFGFRFLCSYGHLVGVHEKRIKFMQYMFLRHGKPIVFVFRFVLFLRSWESLLAGANAMAWRKFFPTNLVASFSWVCAWGLGAYGLGKASKSVLMWASLCILLVIAVALFFSWRYFRKHEDELEARADKALPGPLQPHRRADVQKNVQNRASG